MIQKTPAGVGIAWIWRGQARGKELRSTSTPKWSAHLPRSKTSPVTLGWHSTMQYLIQRILLCTALRCPCAAKTDVTQRMTLRGFAAKTDASALAMHLPDAFQVIGMECQQNYNFVWCLDVLPSGTPNVGGNSLNGLGR